MKYLAEIKPLYKIIGKDNNTHDFRCRELQKNGTLEFLLCNYKYGNPCTLDVVDIFQCRKREGFSHY